jgi:hypothetical protein
MCVSNCFTFWIMHFGRTKESIPESHHIGKRCYEHGFPLKQVWEQRISPTRKDNGIPMKRDKKDAKKVGSNSKCIIPNHEKICIMYSQMFWN